MDPQAKVEVNLPTKKVLVDSAEDRASVATARRSRLLGRVREPRRAHEEGRASEPDIHRECVRITKLSCTSKPLVAVSFLQFDFDTARQRSKERRLLRLRHVHTLKEGIEMEKTLLAIAATVFITGAFAQSQTSEAVPQTNTKSQAAAEAKKSAKPAGVKQIQDGSTAEGQGSGVKKTTKSEMRGQDRKEAREARPHRDPVPGGTPQ